MGSNSLTDSSAVHANRMGEITKEQSNNLKSQLGSVSGWLTLGIMAALFALAVASAGSVLAKSTALGIGAVVVIIVVAFVITSMIGGIIGGARMAKITVEPSPGEIVWDGNHYVARSNGRTLQSITSGLNLDPGNYTFYVAHGTKWLLSAEPASAARQPDAPPDIAQLKALLQKPLNLNPGQSQDQTVKEMAEYQRAAEGLRNLDPDRLSQADKDALTQLMRARSQQVSALLTAHGGLQTIGHLAQAMEQASLQPLDSQGLAELNRALEATGAAKPSALATNQAGQLTGGQRGALLKDLQSYVFWAIVVLAGGIALAYLGLSKMSLTGVLAAGAFFVVVEVFMLSQAWADLSDWMGGRALMAEGPVWKFTRMTHGGRSSHTHYYFKIDQLQLEVWRRVYEALLPGRKYRLYYTPTTKRLVNIETLG